MNYDFVKDKLNEHGEMIVFMECGAKLELHSTDVVFDDKSETFSFSKGDEEHYWDGNAVEGIEVHYSHLVGGV